MTHRYSPIIKFKELTYERALREGIARVALIADTDGVVIGHAAGGVDAAGTGTGIPTFGADARLVRRTVAVEQALGPTAHRWIARVVPHAGAHRLAAGLHAAGRVRAAGRGVAGVARRRLLGDLGLLGAACEGVAGVAGWAGADGIVVLDGAAGEHAAGAGAGVQAFLAWR